MKSISLHSCAILLAAASVLGLAPKAGATLVTISGGPGSPLGNSIPVDVGGLSLVAYGADVTKVLQFGVYEGQIDLVSNYAHGQQAAWIFENYQGLTGAGLAIQLAIWDVMNDGGDGLSSGLVQLSPFAPLELRNLAAGIVGASAGQSSVNASIILLTADGRVWQPLITSLLQSEVSGAGLAEVPEPGGAWGLLAACLGMGWRYNRRR